jgi:hypothetical protein
MRLSWNEIRARAAHFADEWKDAHYEKGQAQTFYNEFFEVFGVKNAPYEPANLPQSISADKIAAITGEERMFLPL